MPENENYRYNACDLPINTIVFDRDTNAVLYNIDFNLAAYQFKLQGAASVFIKPSDRTYIGDVGVSTQDFNIVPNYNNNSSDQTFCEIYDCRVTGVPSNYVEDVGFLNYTYFSDTLPEGLRIKSQTQFTDYICSETGECQWYGGLDNIQEGETYIMTSPLDINFNHPGLENYYLSANKPIKISIPNNINNSPSIATNPKDFKIFSNKNEVFAFSTDTRTIPAGCGTLVQFDISGRVNYIDNIQFIDETGAKIEVTYDDSGLSSLDSVGYTQNFVFIDNQDGDHDGEIYGWETNEGDQENGVGPSWESPEIHNPDLYPPGGGSSWGCAGPLSLPCDPGTYVSGLVSGTCGCPCYITNQCHPQCCSSTSTASSSPLFTQFLYEEDVLTNQFHQPENFPLDQINYNYLPLNNLNSSLGTPLYTLFIEDAMFERNDENVNMSFTISIKSNNQGENHICTYKEPQEFDSNIDEDISGILSWITNATYHWYLPTWVGTENADTTVIRGWCPSSTPNGTICSSCGGYWQPGGTQNTDGSVSLDNPPTSTTFPTWDDLSVSGLEINLNASHFIKNHQEYTYSGAGIDIIVDTEDLGFENNQHIQPHVNTDGWTGGVNLEQAGVTDDELQVLNDAGMGILAKWDYNPLVNCYDFDRNINTDNRVFRFVAFNWGPAGIPYNTIHEAGDSGIKLFTISLNPDHTQENITNLLPEHLMNFVNSLGCYQSNTLASEGGYSLYFDFEPITLNDIAADVDISGCMNPEAYNCISEFCCTQVYPEYPTWFPFCENLPADYYATIPDNSCQERILGCMDNSALNYDSTANVSCENSAWDSDGDGVADNCSLCYWSEPGSPENCNCDGNILLGDVNCDGVVNVVDIQNAMNYIMNVPDVETPQCMAAFDTNGDGSYNIMDLYHIVGCINDYTQPICSETLAVYPNLFYNDLSLLAQTSITLPFVTPSEFYLMLLQYGEITPEEMEEMVELNWDTTWIYTYGFIEEPTNGTVVDNGDGTFTYTNECVPSEFGGGVVCEDSFSYNMFENRNFTTLPTEVPLLGSLDLGNINYDGYFNVNITAMSPNQTPTFEDFTYPYFVQGGTFANPSCVYMYVNDFYEYITDVDTNDPSTYSFSIVTQPSHGDAALGEPTYFPDFDCEILLNECIDPEPEVFMYCANNNFNTTDHVQIEVCDIGDSCDTAIISFNIINYHPSDNDPLNDEYNFLEDSIQNEIILQINHDENQGTETFIIQDFGEPPQNFNPFLQNLQEVNGNPESKEASVGETFWTKWGGKIEIIEEGCLIHNMCNILTQQVLYTPYMEYNLDDEITFGSGYTQQMNGELATGIILISMTETPEERPEFEISFRPFSEPSGQNQGYGGNLQQLEDNFISSNVPLNIYAPRGNDGFIPITFENDEAALELFDVASILGYMFKVEQITPNPNDDIKLITHIRYKFYNSAGDVIYQETKLLDRGAEDINENPLEDINHLKAMGQSGENIGLFTLDEYPSNSNNFTMPTITQQSDWSISRISFKPISNVDFGGIDYHDWDRKDLYLNRNNYTTITEHHSPSISYDAVFNEDLQGLEEYYNIVIPVSDFTSLPHTHLKLNIENNPEYGTVEVANSGIACLHCSGGISDNFYIRYNPNENWNSSKEVNGEFTLDNIRIGVEELLFESSRNTPFTTEGERHTLRDVFNDIYVTQQCFPVDGNPYCISLNTADGYSNWAGFDFRLIPSNNYNLIDHSGQLNYSYIIPDEYLTINNFNVSDGSINILDKFSKDIAIEVLPIADIPTVNVPEEDWPVHIEEGEFHRVFSYNLTEIFSFPDFQPGNQDNVVYDIRVINESNIEQFYDIDIYSSAPDHNHNTSEVFILGTNTGRIISLRITQSDHKFYIDVPPYTDYIPEIQFYIHAKVMSDEGNTIYQEEFIFSSIKVENAHIIPFDSIALNNELQYQLRVEDFGNYLLDLKNPLWYHGDVSVNLVNPDLNEWNLETNQLANADMETEPSHLGSISNTIYVNHSGTHWLDIMFYENGIELMNRQEYEVRFTISASKARTIPVVITKNQYPFTNYNFYHVVIFETDHQAELGTSIITKFISSDIDGIESNARLTFMLGNQQEHLEMEGHTFFPSGAGFAPPPYTEYPEGITEDYYHDSYITISDVSVKKVDNNLIYVSDIEYSGIEVEDVGDYKLALSSINNYNGPANLDFRLTWTDPGEPPHWIEYILEERRTHNWNIINAVDPIAIDDNFNNITFQHNQGFTSSTQSFTGTNVDLYNINNYYLQVLDNSDGALENVEVFITDSGMSSGLIEGYITYDEIQVPHDSYQNYISDRFILKLEFTDEYGANHVVDVPFAIRINPVNNPPELVPYAYEDFGDPMSGIPPTYIPSILTENSTIENRYFIQWMETQDDYVDINGHMAIRDEYTNFDDLSITFNQVVFEPPLGIATLTEANNDYSNMQSGPFMIEATLGEVVYIDSEEYKLVNLRLRTDANWESQAPEGDSRQMGTSYIAEVTITVTDDGVNEGSNLLSASKTIYFQIGDFPGCQDNLASNYDPNATLDCNNVGGTCYMPGDSSTGIATLYNLQDVITVHPSYSYFELDMTQLSPNKKDVFNVGTIVTNETTNFGFGSDIEVEIDQSAFEAPTCPNEIQNGTFDIDLSLWEYEASNLGPTEWVWVEPGICEFSGYSIFGIHQAVHSLAGSEDYPEDTLYEIRITVDYLQGTPEGKFDILNKVGGRVNLNQGDNVLITTLEEGYLKIKPGTPEDSYKNATFDNISVTNLDLYPDCSELTTFDDYITFGFFTKINSQIQIGNEYTGLFGTVIFNYTVDGDEETTQEILHSIDSSDFMGLTSELEEINPFTTTTHLDEWIWVTLPVRFPTVVNEMPISVKSWNFYMNGQNNPEASIDISELAVQQTTTPFIPGGGTLCSTGAFDNCGTESVETGVVTPIPDYRYCIWEDFTEDENYVDTSCCIYMNLYFEAEQSSRISSNCEDDPLGFGLGKHSITYIDYPFGGSGCIESELVNEFTIIPGTDVNITIATTDETNEDFMPDRFKLLFGNYECGQYDILIPESECFGLQEGDFVEYQQAFYYVFYPYGNFGRLYEELMLPTWQYMILTEDDDVDAGAYFHPGAGGAGLLGNLLNDPIPELGDNSPTYIEWLKNGLANPLSEILAGLIFTLQKYLEISQLVYHCTEADIGVVPGCDVISYTDPNTGVPVITDEDGFRYQTVNGLSLYRRIEFEANLTSEDANDVLDIEKTISWNYLNSQLEKTINFQDVLTSLDPAEQYQQIESVRKALKYIYYYPNTKTNFGDYSKLNDCTSTEEDSDLWYHQSCEREFITYVGVINNESQQNSSNPYCHALTHSSIATGEDGYCPYAETNGWMKTGELFDTDYESMDNVDLAKACCAWMDNPLGVGWEGVGIEQDPEDYLPESCGVVYDKWFSTYTKHTCYKLPGSSTFTWEDPFWKLFEFNYYDLIKWIHGFLSQPIHNVIRDQFPETVNSSNTWVLDHIVNSDPDDNMQINKNVNNVHKFLSLHHKNHFGIPDDLKFGHLIRPEIHIFKHQALPQQSSTFLCSENAHHSVAGAECTSTGEGPPTGDSTICNPPLLECVLPTASCQGDYSGNSECTPNNIFALCGNVEYDDSGEIIEGTGGICMWDYISDYDHQCENIADECGEDLDGDGFLDGLCLQIDYQAECLEIVTTNLIPSDKVNPIDTAEEGSNMCLIQDYPISNETCTRVGVIGGIKNDPIETAGDIDPYTNSDNFGYLPQNSTSFDEHTHLQINILDPILIESNPIITMDYLSALYDGFGYYRDDYHPGAVQGAWTWMNLRETINYDDYLSLTNNHSDNLPNFPALDMYDGEVIFEYDYYTVSGLRYLQPWGNEITFTGNNLTLDLNHHAEISEDFSLSEFYIENLLSSFDSIDDVDSYRYDNAGNISSDINLVFRSNPFYYDPISENNLQEDNHGLMTYHVKTNFTQDVWENAGPVGSGYYFIQPTFGNNPNKIRFFPIGDDQLSIGPTTGDASSAGYPRCNGHADCHESDYEHAGKQFCHSGWNGYWYGPRFCVTQNENSSDNNFCHDNYTPDAQTSDILDTIASVWGGTSSDLLSSASMRCGIGDGDCDSDNDCAGGLLCFQEHWEEYNPGNPEEHNPGNCSFAGLGDFNTDHDCCYDKDLGAYELTYSTGLVENLWRWPVKDGILEYHADDLTDVQKDMLTVQQYQVLIEDPQYINTDIEDDNYNPLGYRVLNISPAWINEWETHPMWELDNWLDLFTFASQDPGGHGAGGITNIYRDNGDFHIIIRARAPLSNYQFTDVHPFIEFCDSSGDCRDVEFGERDLDLNRHGLSEQQYEIKVFNVIEIQQSIGDHINSPYRYYNPYRGVRIAADYGEALDGSNPCYDGNDLNEDAMSVNMQIFEQCNADGRSTLGVFTPAIDITGAQINCSSEEDCTNDMHNHVATVDTTFDTSNSSPYTVMDWDQLGHSSSTNRLYSIDADIRPEASDLIDIESNKLPESTMKYWDIKYNKDAYLFNSAPVGIRMFLYAREFAYLDNSTALSNIFDERNHMNFDRAELLDNLTALTSDEIFELDVESGLYVCDLDWGDGTEIENPCNSFWIQENKTIYTDFQLDDDKLFYHTFETSGTFNIRGVVFVMTKNPSQDPIIWSSKMFVATIQINTGRNDSDFEFLGGDIDNPLLPLGEPYNSEQSLPVIGGFSTESLYYKYIASYLGYKPTFLTGNLNPVADHVFSNVGSKRDMLEQISLINEDIKYNFISDDTINIIGQSTLYGDLNAYTGSLPPDTEENQNLLVVDKKGNPVASNQKGFYDYIGSDYSTGGDVCSGQYTLESETNCGNIFIVDSCVSSPDWLVHSSYCDTESNDCAGGGCCRVRCIGTGPMYYPSSGYAIVDTVNSCTIDLDCNDIAEQFCHCMDITGYDPTGNFYNSPAEWEWDAEFGNGHYCHSTYPTSGTLVTDDSVGCGDDQADNYSPLTGGPIPTKNVCGECTYTDTLADVCNSVEKPTIGGQMVQACMVEGDCPNCECVPYSHSCGGHFNSWGICDPDCSWQFSENNTGGFDYDPFTGEIDESRLDFAILIDNGKYKRRGELGEYPGEIDLEDVKFNIGVEPLYKHFIGDKNCSVAEPALLGQVSHDNCGTNCRTLCYNNVNQEYYYQPSKEDCERAGHTSVQCLAVRDDGCYTPIIGASLEQCCNYRTASYIEGNEAENLVFCEQYTDQFSCESSHCFWDGHICSGTIYLDGGSGANSDCQNGWECLTDNDCSWSTHLTWCIETPTPMQVKPTVCAGCVEDLTIYDDPPWIPNPEEGLGETYDLDTGYCDPFYRYCRPECGIDCDLETLVCNECGTQGEAPSPECVERYLHGDEDLNIPPNPGCALDEYQCPEDLTCKTVCCCDSGYGDHSKLTCVPPKIGCTDPLAMNYIGGADTSGQCQPEHDGISNIGLTCQAPIGHYNECWYYPCNPQGTETHNCHPNLRCKCLIEHVIQSDLDQHASTLRNTWHDAEYAEINEIGTSVEDLRFIPCPQTFGTFGSGNENCHGLPFIPLSAEPFNLEEALCGGRCEEYGQHPDRATSTERFGNFGSPTGGFDVVANITAEESIKWNNEMGFGHIQKYVPAHGWEAILYPHLVAAEVENQASAENVPEGGDLPPEVHYEFPEGRGPGKHPDCTGTCAIKAIPGNTIPDFEDTTWFGNLEFYTEIEYNLCANGYICCPVVHFVKNEDVTENSQIYTDEIAYNYCTDIYPELVVGENPAGVALQCNAQPGCNWIDITIIEENDTGVCECDGTEAGCGVIPGEPTLEGPADATEIGSPICGSQCIPENAFNGNCPSFEEWIASYHIHSPKNPYANKGGEIVETQYSLPTMLDDEHLRVYVSFNHDLPNITTVTESLLAYAEDMLGAVDDSAYHLGNQCFMAETTSDHWKEEVRDNRSNYDGACPSRWWCDKEKLGKLVQLPDEFADQSVEEWDMTLLDGNSAHLVYGNFFYNAFYEYEQCANTSYPVADNYELCGGDGGGPDDDEECKPCSGSCRSELDLWLAEPIPVSGHTNFSTCVDENGDYLDYDTSAECIDQGGEWQQTSNTGNTSNKRFGLSGPLPRRVVGAPSMGQQSCEPCPCFCDRPYKDGVGFTTPTIADTPGLDFWNAASGGDFPFPEVITLPDGTEWPGGPFDPETGAVSPWLMNIHKACDEENWVHSNGLTDGQMTVCCDNGMDCCIPESETVGPPALTAGQCEEFNNQFTYLNNVPSGWTVDDMANIGIPCTQTTYGIVMCDGCDFSIPTSVLPAIAGVIKFNPSAPVGQQVEQFTPEELGLSLGSSECYIPDPEYFVNFIYAHGPWLDSLLEGATNICNAWDYCNFTDLGELSSDDFWQDYINNDLTWSHTFANVICGHVYHGMATVLTEDVPPPHGGLIFYLDMTLPGWESMFNWYLACLDSVDSAYTAAELAAEQNGGSMEYYMHYQLNTACDCGEPDCQSETITYNSGMGNWFNLEDFVPNADITIDAPYEWCQPAGQQCYDYSQAECDTDDNCNYIATSCQPVNPTCTPPPLPEKIEMEIDCDGPTACFDPLKCWKYHFRVEEIRKELEGDLRNRDSFIDEQGEYIHHPYDPKIKDFRHVDNPASPFYWQNIIPEDYDITIRTGIDSSVEQRMTRITNVDLEDSQEFKGSHEFVPGKETAYMYPVLPKINYLGKHDEDIYGIQTIDIDYGFNFACRILKTPFLGRNLSIHSLNNKQCEGGWNPDIHPIPPVYFELDTNWNDYGNCDVANDNSLYEGLINLDFSELIENQLLNCVNSDCVGFVVGDYKVDVVRKKNRRTGIPELVLNENKLTTPVLPNISGKDDGVR